MYIFKCILYFICILWWLCISAKTADCKEKLNNTALSAGGYRHSVDSDPACWLLKSKVGFLQSTEVLLFNVTLHLAFPVSPSWISCSNTTYLSPFVSGSIQYLDCQVLSVCPWDALLAPNKGMYVFWERNMNSASLNWLCCYSQ